MIHYRKVCNVSANLTLVCVCPACSFEAVAFVDLARGAVDLVHVRGAVLAVSGAVLGQVALVGGWTAHLAGRLDLAGGQVAAGAGGASGVGKQAAGRRVAARVVAIVLKATVAFFALTRKRTKVALVVNLRRHWNR